MGEVKCELSLQTAHAGCARHLLQGMLYVLSNHIIDFMRNSEHTTLARIRWGGAAAILAGLSYEAAGYLDTPGISGSTSVLVSVLSVTTPALFLGGLLGFRFLLGGVRSPIKGTGFFLGCLGIILGIIAAVGSGQNLLWLSSIGSWWWALLFGGLTLMGLSSLLKEALRLVGGLGARVGGARLGLIAHRSCFPRCTGVYATGPRCVCSFVVSELRSMGMDTFCSAAS